MFTAAQFTIIKICRQPRCSTTDEWIKNVAYVHMMEYYSTIMRNDGTGDYEK